MLAENRGSTVSYKGSSQQWHCYYAFMLGSLSCLPMMSGSCYAVLKEWLLPSLPRDGRRIFFYFTTKTKLWTLANNLGCFPLEYES